MQARHQMPPSSPEKFRWSVKNDFFNTIEGRADLRRGCQNSTSLGASTGDPPSRAKISNKIEESTVHTLEFVIGNFNQALPTPPITLQLAEWRGRHSQMSFISSLIADSISSRVFAGFFKRRSLSSDGTRPPPLSESFEQRA
jgi:hypothetical protein